MNEYGSEILCYMFTFDMFIYKFAYELNTNFNLLIYILVLATEHRFDCLREPICKVSDIQWTSSDFAIGRWTKSSWAWVLWRDFETAVLLTWFCNRSEAWNDWISSVCEWWHPYHNSFYSCFTYNNQNSPSIKVGKQYTLIVFKLLLI